MSPELTPTLNESETRAKLIDPALHAAGWTEDLIRREETKGAIEVVQGKPRRRPKRTDYILRCRTEPGAEPVALALIEAKAEDKPPAHGLEQGKAYSRAELFNVKFVFSSNGHQFVEYDHFTGQTSAPRPMSEFPTPQDLRKRYEAGIGFSLTDQSAKPLLQPYKGGDAARRYYQDAAIRATLEKLAKCDKTGEPKRALLALATGSGKTRLAVQLLKKISDAGNMGRALFICDRDELRTQALAQFQDAFGNDAVAVGPAPGGGNVAANARVHIATYQTLGVANEADDASFLLKHYPEDYFSHIIIDECHRSAWGKWSQVLLRNPNAAQIGLTATPRQLKWERTPESEVEQQVSADNVKHFGEPVYEYTMTQAIEDGYLAACLIQKGRVNVDDTGITIQQVMERNPRNAVTGQPLTAAEVRELYEANTFEDKLQLPDRVEAMCQDLFAYLLASGGPQQKTIIFCVRDSHADAVAAKMNNLYAKWCTEAGEELAHSYAFKCTAASGGNDQLPDFRASKTSYFVACTVDLISTGVDVPCVRNIVFFRYVKSPILFHQMLGRGTRLDEETGKLMFTVYDYTDATRLLAEDFVTAPPRDPTEPIEPPAPPETPIILDGIEVHVSDQGRFVVVDRDGKAHAMPLEEYEAKLAERILSVAPTLEAFRALWISPQERRELIDSLVQAGLSPAALRVLKGMAEYDHYDVLGEAAYGLLARTRDDRTLAFRYKHEEWLLSLPEDTRKALLAITAQFAKDGTDGLESNQLFSVPEVAKAGGLSALRKAGEPSSLVNETKERVFSA